MKIAVIGGGIFGVSISFILASDHSIDLYEKNPDILMSASDINQCRIHRGYHYPRSDDTVRQLLDSNSSFTTVFSDAIMYDTENFYSIASKDSLTSASEYIEFCKRNNLEYEKYFLPLLNDKTIEFCVKVNEHLFDHKKLKEICWKKLKESKVNVLLNTEATKKIFGKYDFIIICTYGDWEHLVPNTALLKQDFQFEVCEKVFVTLPKTFSKKSILVMDGPFVSIDPVGDSDLFILYDVAHTVLQRSFGKSPKIDSKFLPYLNKGLLPDCPISNYQKFIQTASRFVPEIKNAKYIGSSFCVRATLSNVDATDSRPTIIDQIDEKIITVFSGKIPTCIHAAQKIKKMLNKI